MTAAPPPPAVPPRLTEDQLIELRAWVGVKLQHLQQQLTSVTEINEELMTAGRVTQPIPQVSSARRRLDKWRGIYDALAEIHRYTPERETPEP